MTQSETRELSFLDLDHPPASDLVPRIPTPEPVSPPRMAPTSSMPDLLRSETTDLPSPAFIKRARVSYGSLLDLGYDIFAENDGSVEGKSRKRAKLGRESGFGRSSLTSWRVSSRSPSPEIDTVDDDAPQNASPEPPQEPVQNTKPMMMDEGCQTMDVPANEMLPPPPRLSDTGQGMELPNMHTYSQNGVYRTPLSPRLQPLPSDGLPLVSPIGDREFVSYFGDGERQIAHSMQTQTSPWQRADGANEIASVEEPEDIYNTSPLRNQSSQVSNFGQAFGQPMPTINYDSIQDMMSVPNPDLSDQYGHWQTAIAARESAEQDTEPQQHEGYHAEMIERISPLADSEDAQFEPQQIYSYPEPDHDAFSELRQPQGWGADVTSALYPQLPLIQENGTRPFGSREGSRDAEAIDLAKGGSEKQDHERGAGQLNSAYANEPGSNSGRFENGLREGDMYPRQTIEQSQRVEEGHTEWAPRATNNYPHRHDPGTYKPEYVDEDREAEDARSSQAFGEARTKVDFESDDEAEGRPSDDEYDGSQQSVRDRNHQMQDEDEDGYEEDGEEGTNDQEYESEDEYDAESEEDEQPQMLRVPTGPPEIIDLLSDSDDEPATAAPGKSPASSSVRSEDEASDEEVLRHNINMLEDGSEEDEDMSLAGEQLELRV